MEDIEFNKHVRSAFKQALNGKISLLNFLNENEIETVKKIKKEFQINAYFDGGFINSESQRCLITDYDTFDFKINIYNIIYNKKYYTLTHRSILGSLMGLGIKRECIGDIYIDDNKNCYFASTDEISPFLLAEFKYVGACPIKIEEIDYPIEIERKYQEKKYFVSSLRLDVLISSVYNISRKDTLEIIMAGDAKVNHAVCLNPTKIIKKDDLISLKHYGRFIFKDELGKSKSDRIAISIAIQV